MSSTSGIVVAAVSVVYRSGHVGLREACCTVPAGAISALVGMNGSGKSTLFKAIMGLLPLAGGRIDILGQTPDAARRAGLIAYVPQSEEVDWNFPVRVEDVAMMGRYGRMNTFRIARRADRHAVAAALERVGLADLRGRQIGELSGGQKKRAFLARALAQDARVLLLDEPFAGVDVTSEDAIIALLRELSAEGRTVLVSTHNLGSVPEFCDHAVLLNRSVLASGSTAEVFTRAHLQAAFGGMLRHFVFADGDQRAAGLGILTDDERPLVLVDGRATARGTDDAAATRPAPSPAPAGRQGQCPSAPRWEGVGTLSPNPRPGQSQSDWRSVGGEAVPRNPPRLRPSGRERGENGAVEDGASSHEQLPSPIYGRGGGGEGSP